MLPGALERVPPNQYDNHWPERAAGAWKLDWIGSAPRELRLARSSEFCLFIILIKSRYIVLILERK